VKSSPITKENFRQVLVDAISRIINSRTNDKTIEALREFTKTTELARRSRITEARAVLEEDFMRDITDRCKAIVDTTSRETADDVARGIWYELSRQGLEREFIPMNFRPVGRSTLV